MNLVAMTAAGVVLQGAQLVATIAPPTAQAQEIVAPGTVQMAVPVDNRSTWQRNAPNFLGGKDAPPPIPVIVGGPTQPAAPVRSITTASYAPPANNYAPPKAAPIDYNAPAWFTRLPEDSNDAIFSAGTAVSIDEQMAYDKARMSAERKILEMVGSKVKSMTKSYANDQGNDDMAETTEIAIKKTANGDLVNLQQVDSQVTFDGKRYKVYVLVRYPLDENSVLRKNRASALANHNMKSNSQRAFDELDADERPVQAQQQNSAPLSYGPAPTNNGVVVNPIPTPMVNSAPVSMTNGNNGNIQFLDVNNAEYKARRDAALQQPGAVIGQISYHN